VSNDLKLAIFLGAGASVPYNKPTTRQLKHALLKKYPHEDTTTINPEPFYLNSIISFTGFDDIEHVLQCIKEIHDFFSDSQYGAKYLMGREYKLFFHEKYGPSEFRILTDNIKKLRTRIEDDVFENYSWDHSADDTLAHILDQLFNMVRKASHEIHIFTTNYDRAIEEYCSRKNRKCRCIDGFNTDEFSGRRLWTGTYSYPLVEDITNVYLYKLHGSLNWKKHKIYGIEATSEERRSNDPNYIENLLVYPTVSPKDEVIEPEPYNTIRTEFKKYLEAVDLCIIIGFSFRDEHINTVFSDFLKRGKIVVISPSAENDFYSNLMKKEFFEPDGTMALDGDETLVCSIREKQSVITLNESLTAENSEKIMKMIIQIINTFCPGKL